MNPTLTGYRPQAFDTHPQVDQFQMLAFRRMPLWKKAHLINEATKALQQWALIGIRNQYPNATPAEVQFHLAVRWLGKETAHRLYRNSSLKIVDAESISLTLRVADILETLKVPYLVGGSVASSILGEPRATLDVDFVADLQPAQVQPLVEMMTVEFFIDEMMVREAIARKSSFNIIHLDTMQKVDIFVLSDEPLAQTEMQRRQQLIVTENPERLAWFASAEDIILQKLIWYRMSNGVSDRQWRDVLGVLKVQAKLDYSYLSQWAESQGLVDLLVRAMREAGVTD